MITNYCSLHVAVPSPTLLRGESTATHRLGLVLIVQMIKRKKKKRIKKSKKKKVLVPFRVKFKLKLTCLYR